MRSTNPAIEAAVDRMVDDCMDRIREDSYESRGSFVELHESVDAIDYLTLSIDAEAKSNPALAAAIRDKRRHLALMAELAARVDARLAA